MGRQLRTTLASHPHQLNQKWPDLKKFREKDIAYREKQAAQYDKRHAAKALPELKPGEKVWHRDTQREATVVTKSNTPRSYVVTTQDGSLRRNRRALIPLHEGRKLDDEPPDFPQSTSTQLAEPKISQTVEPTTTPPRRKSTTDGRSPRRGQHYTTASGRISKPPKVFDL